MSKVQLQGNVSGTGVFTIASPNSNTDRTLTLPDNTGTILTSASTVIQNGGPAFSAFQTSGQTISFNTETKILFEAEEFDTNNNFASSRFTPTVAGYYQLNTNIRYGTPAWIDASFYKNGSKYKAFSYSFSSNVSGTAGSIVVYLNGSTDFVEVYVRWGGSGTALQAGSESTWFNGALVRAA
jgi:hypothetical protein